MGGVMLLTLRKIVVLLFILLPCTIISDETQKSAGARLTPTQQLVTAGAMSTVGAFVDGPLNFWKYRLQLPASCDAHNAATTKTNATNNSNVPASAGSTTPPMRPASAVNPFALWRGTSLNILRAFPNLAAQVGIMQGAKRMEEQNPEFKGSVAASLLPSVAAGVVSGAIATPTDLLIMKRQYTGKNCFEIVKNTAKDHGWQAFCRGGLAKIGRNILNASGYWGLAPKLEEKLQPHLKNETAAKIVANVTVGLPITVLNQPFDTVSSVMQSDLGKNCFKHFTHTACTLYDQGNRRLYWGLKSRLVGAAIGFPLARITQDYVTGLFAKRNNEAKQRSSV